MITVLDINNTTRQLTIDAGMKVYGLKVVGKTIVIKGGNKSDTWTLNIITPGVKLGIEDCIEMKVYGVPWHK